MMYLVLICFLSIGLLCIDRLPSSRCRFTCNTALAAAGVILFFGVWLWLYTKLSACTPDYAAWAWDGMTLYWRIAGGSLALFFCVLLFPTLGALVDERYRTTRNIRLRRAGGAICSLALFLSAACFAPVLENATLPLSRCALLCGISFGLFLRSIASLESIWQRKKK